MLNFKDAMGLVSGGSLKQFAENFGGSKLGNKGAFPYDLITSETYKTVFASSESLPIDQFFSSLINANFDYIHYKPTLDRIDYKARHSISNTKPCCEYCNCTKSNHDEHAMRLKLQIRNFAIYHGLPFSLGAGDEKLRT